MSPEKCRALLEPVIRPEQGFTWDEIEERLANGTAQLWTNDGAALLTEVVGDALHFWLAAGEMRPLLSMRDPLENLARSYGLKRTTIDGRIGWNRVMRPYGYLRCADGLEKHL